ncbi:hypothetical protein AVEN_27984-1 [Araneus ventricosus]|uniref:Tc1-like transposase DDE domain-containing protein n=1 Tax=Araneus ventricosus TaxID=182803 RepID=A0A4Y2BFX5_ARAVE|nr:hypothetical protein AVEN_27984-1 [Araneus ventricosus]
MRWTYGYSCRGMEWCYVMSAVEPLPKGIKIPVEDVRVGAGESPHFRLSLPVAMCQTLKDTNGATAGVATLLCGLLSLQWVPIFMDDNARPHRARLVRSYLESETIPQMAWPATSPDLNPMEHVWDMLGRRIAGRSVPPGTLHELQQALLQEWALLPQQAINDTIVSMSRRCQACISARG